MSQLETLLQTQDVAVEDLLKVEVSYGRLQLLLKMILDTVKSNAAEMKDMKNAQEDLANDQNNLNNKLNDLQNKQAAAKRDQDAMKAMQDHLKGELAKTMDKAGVKQTAPPPPPPPPSEPEKTVSEDDWNALENRTRKLENTVSKLKDEIAALKANVGSGNQSQPAPVARLPELDDSILDDLMANHERRLKNLEEELQRSIARLQSLSGRRPSSAFQTSKNITPKLDGVPGAITSIHVNPALSLIAGGPSGQIRFVLSTPASGGPLKLIPQMDDIVFDPPAVTVPVGSMESQPCTITAGKEAMIGANFIPVALESQNGNNNNITGSPLAATGLTIMPGSKISSTAAGKPKTTEPTTTSAASSSSKKPQQEQPKVGGSKSGDVPKTDDKKSATLAAPDKNATAASSANSVPAVAVKRVSLSAPLQLGVTGGPVYFNVEPPALGGDIILTPEAPNLEFLPPTVVVPAGSSSSGSFVVKALSTATPGPTPIVVAAKAVGPNYNDLSNSPYQVDGVTVDPAQKPLRATVDKIESKPGVVNTITLMPGTSLSAGGDSSNYLSFVVEPQAPSGGLKLTPRAQGLHFTPSSVVVPAGHSQSQPFVVRADATAPPGSALVSVVASPVNDQSHTIGPIEAVGLTIEGLPSAYHTIGSRPTSAAVPGHGGDDEQQRLLRSGLSDRLRQLMDDHERRIKGLEAQYRAVLDRVQQEREKMGQPKATDTSSVNGADPFLEEALKQINERLDALQQGPDPAALSHQLDTLKNRVNSLEDHALNSAPSPTATSSAPVDHRLNQVVREMQNQLASLQSKPEIDPASLRKLADDLRHLTLRVVSLESAPPALMEGNTTPVASGIDEALIQSRLKGLQDAIDAVRQRTGQLDSDVQKVKGQVMEFNARSELNSTRLGNLEDKAQTQGNQLKTLKDQVEELQKGLERLKDAMEGMDLALRRDEEGIKMLNMRLTTMGGQQQLQEKKEAKKSAGDAPPVSASVMANMEDLRNLIGQLQTMIEEANQNIANLEQVKANKSDLNAALIRINDAEEKLKLLGSKVDATAKQIASRSQRDPASPATNSGQPISSDIINDLGDLRVLVSTHSTMIDNLFADKASRDTVVRQGQEIQELKLFLDSKRWGAGGGGGAGGGNTFLGLNRNDADLSPITNLLQEHDQAIKKLQAGKADKDAVHQITEKLKGWIEDLQLNKADAAIVAGKAERDYVENALEKLRREVEAVMNNTNSGLIDTLDKSLNILRDMIDGKANLADMLKLREALMSENKKDEVPDGLAGYKHYRCLSCNRKMDAMRPRPMGMNFMNFMSHLPAPRTKFYQKNGIPPLLPSTINSTRALPSTATTGMIADHDNSNGQLPPIPAPAIAAPINDQMAPEVAAEDVYASDNE